MTRSKPPVQTTYGPVEKLNKDTLYFVVIIPVLIVAMFVAYNFLQSYANKDSRVCSALGKVWLFGVPGPDNPNPRRGCLTYQELYSE